MKKILFLSVFFVAACSTSKRAASGHEPVASVVINGKLWASAFQQKAAEYKALCQQAYNVAEWRLAEDLKNSSSKPRAVITDIDETVLDNSPYAVAQALHGKDFDQASWNAWTALAQADTLAGALSFFKYAAKHNVEVFYVTNRYEEERSATLKNLQKFGFPYADDTHLILRQPGSSSSKETRRNAIAQTHNIVLLLGDNLADFDVLFDAKKWEDRNAATAKSASRFGNKYIVFPNPSYGDWEGAMYNNNFKLSASQKDSVIKAEVRGK